MATPFISAAGGGTGSQLDAAALASSSISADSSFDTKPGTSGKLLKDLSSAGALGLSFSGHSPEAFLSSTGLALSLKEDTKDRYHVTLGALFSVLGASAGTDPALATALHNSFYLTDTTAESVVMPLLSLSKQEELGSVTDDKIKISDSQLRVGSVSANIFIYKGQKQYTVTGLGLDQPYIIKPNDKFLALHVNQKGEKYTDMDALSRVRVIKNDFKQLCELLDNPKKFGLSNEQNKQIESLQEAPMIGVSHLVRLIATKKLPTWDIQVLPKAIQRFHTLDSQIVSNLFGGKRKVNINDIGVMFLPSYLRPQIV